MEITLDPIAVRVLGSLIEKEATTPDYYPMTLNAVVNACNQKSNRDPVMQLSEETVHRSLDDLNGKHLVWKRSVAGARAMKYEQAIRNVFRFSDREIAVLCILMLRGAQTIGEIRLRTERLCAFESLEETEKVIRSLMSRDEGPFVLELPRQPGRKEPRFIHLLSGKEWAEGLAQAPDAAEAATSPLLDAQPSDDRIAELETKVSDLLEQMRLLKKEFEEFKKIVG